MDKRRIDINCDMGESSPLRPDYTQDQDMALMEFVSSINLACGFHAGDPRTMHLLTEVALEKGVAIGAHPSFPDREHFGRKKMAWSPEWLYDQIIYQLRALDAFLSIRGTRLQHVKTHGALYNMAATDKTMAQVLVKAVADYDDRLILVGLSGSDMIQAAKERGLRYANEVFADRTYQTNGTLTSRELPDALLNTTEESINQVMDICLNQQVRTTDNKLIPLQADTVCIHSDGSSALQMASGIYQALQMAGITIRPCH